MNFQDWYTHRMDIYRVEDRQEGSLTRRKRVLTASGVPCRVYQSGKPGLRMDQNAASVSGVDKLMCALDVDIQKGDELLISRGGEPERYFAGKPAAYPEPFGAVLPGLAHQEVSISEEEWA